MIKESLRISVLISVMVMGLISIVATGGGSGGDDPPENGVFSYTGDEDQPVGYPELWDTLPSCRDIIDDCQDQYTSCGMSYCESLTDLDVWAQCWDNCWDAREYCIESQGGDARGIPYVEVDWCDPRGL